MRIWIFAFLLFSACAEPKQLPSDVIVDFEQVPITYAKGFEIFETPQGYQVLIKNPKDTTQILEEYNFASSQTQSSYTSIPVARVALNSTTFVSYFDALGSADLIEGVSYTETVLNQNMRTVIDAGNAIEITEGGAISWEKLISINPDIYMAYEIDDENQSRLEANGINVILNLEYLESHPLGRAEWIKLVGCLTGQLTEAVKIFEDIENQYNELRMMAAFSSQVSSVFTGSRYGDIWYAPSSDSYISQYLRHAGANYVFREAKGEGSLELDYEIALKAASEADFYGMVLSQKEEYTMSQFLSENPDFSEFQMAKQNKIFVCNTLKADYFGDAVVEPHVVLADLISIFHPNYLPEHQNKYFHLLK